MTKYRPRNGDQGELIRNHSSCKKEKPSNSKIETQITYR